MTTAGDLVSLVSSQLHGWGSSRDRVTVLSNDISASDYSFNVGVVNSGALGVNVGVVEIDNEQLLVSEVNSANGTCKVISGFGRGFNGTTAAAHSAGAMVVSQPRYPRHDIMQVLNNIVAATYPMLFAVQTGTATVTAPTDTYSFDPAPEWIINVEWQDPLSRWHQAPSWTYTQADNKIRTGPLPPGRSLRVTYATKPTQFSAESDSFSTTGLPSSCEDVLTLGTVARMVPALDVSRAQLSSVEQSDRNKVVPSNAGVNAAKYVMAEFQMRLQQESETLRRKYKPRIVRKVG